MTPKKDDKRIQESKLPGYDSSFDKMPLSLAGIQFLAIVDQLRKPMKTLTISVSDLDYSKFGLKSNELTFSEFLDLVSQELTRQNLDKCLELADKYGLSQLTIDEITDEVRTVRRNAKNRN